MSAYGFTFRLYRTYPVDTDAGIGILRELISEEWLPSARTCSNTASYRAWKMNGEYTPGSSSGWNGNCRTHSSDPAAPNYDPNAEWFLSFSTREQALFHGYTFAWNANVREYPRPIGPTCAHETPIDIPCSPCEDHRKTRMGTFPDYITEVALETFYQCNQGSTLRNAVDTAFGLTPTDGYPVNAASDPTPHERAAVLGVLSIIRQAATPESVRCVHIAPRDRGGAKVYCQIGSNVSSYVRVEATPQTLVSQYRVRELPTTTR